MRRVITIVIITALLCGAAAVPVAAQGVGADGVHVRLGHFSPGMGDVDVYIDRVLSDVQAFRFSSLSDWYQLPQGTHRISITRSGEPLSAALADASFDLQDGDWVTVAIIGEVIQGTVRLHPVVEDFGPMAPGAARVTFVHAVPDLEEMVVQYADGMPLASGLAFPGSEVAGQHAVGFVTQDVPAGVTALQFVAGDLADMILVQMDDLELRAGKNHLVVMAGLRASAVTVFAVTDPATLVVRVDEEVIGVGQGTARTRIAHYVSGIGPVDLFINGDLADFGTLAFGDATEWFDLPAGFYEIAAAPAGASYADAVIVSERLPLATDESTYLLAIGVPDTGTTGVYPIVEDRQSVNPGEARLTFFHAISDIGPVNIQLENGLPLFIGLDYPGVDGPPMQTVDLVAGPRALEVTSATTQALLLDIPEIILPPGSINLLVMAGLRTNPAFFLLATLP